MVMRVRPVYGLPTRLYNPHRFTRFSDFATYNPPPGFSTIKAESVDARWTPTSDTKYRVLLVSDQFDPLTIGWSPFPELGYPQWQASSIADMHKAYLPTVSNGHAYVPVFQSATNGTVEPTWPTDGSTVDDGEQRWQDIGNFPPFIFNNNYYQNVFGPIIPGEFVPYMMPAELGLWQPTTIYSLGDTVRASHSLSSSGQTYMCITAGTSGGTEPFADKKTPGIVEDPNDGTVRWLEFGYNPGAFALGSSGTHLWDGHPIDDYVNFSVASSLGEEYVGTHYFTLPQEIRIENFTGSNVKYAFIYRPDTIYETWENTLSQGAEARHYGMPIAQIELDDEQASVDFVNDSVILSFSDGPESNILWKNTLYRF